MDWNRKDCDPNTTVNRIQHILSELGIESQLTSDINYRGLWFSNRVEISGLPGIGANGKGISAQFALASAYAELMERIQSGMLLGECFPQKQTRCTDRAVEEVYQLICKLYQESFVLSEDELRNTFSEYPDILETEIYYDVYSGKSEVLPERIVKLFSGTNALAAGNTFEEAFCQGCCEAFERYAVRRIFLGREIIPNIAHEWLTQTKSYALIKEIERKGYRVIIKDCTLGGTIPVVGLLLIDPTASKCKFSLSSDIDIDIALQRCITEVFQGMHFDFTFRKYMRNIEYNSECISVNDQKEYIRAIKDGTGIPPFNVFTDVSSLNNELKPFVSGIQTSYSAMEEICGIIKKTHWKVYVRDCSYLGFPTIRLVIPGITDIYRPILSGSLPAILESIGILKYSCSKYFMNCTDEKSLQKIYTILTTIGDNPVYFENLDFARLTGILVNASKEYEKFEFDMYEYTAHLAYCLGKYNQAKKYIDKSMEYSNSDDIAFHTAIRLWIDGKKAGYTDERIENAVKLINGGKNDLKVHHIVKEKQSLAICNNDCSKCLLSEACCYEQWRTLFDKLVERKTEYQPFSTKDGKNFLHQIISLIH